MSGMRALLALAVLAAGTTHAQTCRFPSFVPILANQPGLTIITQIVKTLEATNSASVPTPADGVTLLAPTDAAFVSLLSTSGLTTGVAQRTLAAKGVSILLYHLLDMGYTPAQLLALTAFQSNLGKTLGVSLPLTFGAGTTAGTIVASGIANEGMLSAATPVCTSQLYVVNAVLLPSRTLATVPAATPARAPAAAPALGPSALGPAVAVAAGPEGQAIAAAAPDTAPVAVSAPGLAPAVGVLAPAAAPDSAPAPAVALVPAPATGPATTAMAPAPATSSQLPAFGALAPAAAPQAAASSAAASAAVLASALAGAVALLAGGGML